MTDNRNVIAAWLTKWPDMGFIERAIFGTADPDQIAQIVNTFCLYELGRSVTEYLFYESSQGAVFGLCLSDGQKVVVKAHQPSRSPEFLLGVYEVQRHLFEHGYPCPRPIIGLRTLGYGYAVAEELVDEGEYTNAHIPSVRRTVAEKLAQLVMLTQDVRTIPGLQSTALGRVLPPNVLWPTPHSNIFDFETTATGAEWIDDLARKARQTILASIGERVIGHSDWSVKHFRFVDGKVRVIYDWDSLALEKEPIIVGEAARGFTMTWFLDVHITPTPDEAQAFIAEYEAVRGRLFSKAERVTLAAAATYALAYGARCEHALNPSATEFPVGSSSEALACYGEAYIAS